MLLLIKYQMNYLILLYNFMLRGWSDMVENSENRPEDQDSAPASDETEEVIELADMTIGTTREDEEIIELTEEVLDEAMGAVSSTTGETEDSENLDLSESAAEEGLALSEAEVGTGGAAGIQEPPSLDQVESEEVEDHISQELDDFFGADEPAKLDSPSPEIEAASVDIEPDQPAAPAISREELESAIERVIENKFVDRIEKMISEMVESRLVEDIEELKKTLLETMNK